MKKVIYFIVILILAYTFNGCKKAELTNSDLSDNEKQIIAESRLFFEKNVEALAARNTESNQSFQKNVQWNNAKVVAKAKNKTVVVVPIKFNNPIQYDANFDSAGKLPLESITELWIYKTNNNKYRAEVKYNFLENPATPLISDGYIVTKEWNNNKIKTQKLKNGKLYKYKSSNNSNRTAREGECLLYTLYECLGEPLPGFVNCRIVYQEILTCDPNSPQWELDNEDLGVGGYGFVDCSTITEEEANEALASFNGMTLNNITSYSTDSEDLLISGQLQETKNAKRDWEFYKAYHTSFFGTATATYSVYFKGKIYKPRNSSSDYWKWHEFTYDGFGQSSGYIPPCMDVEVKMVNSPLINISSDKITAEVTISYTAQGKISCALGWRSTQLYNGTLTNTFKSKGE